MIGRWLSTPAVLRYLGLFGSVCCAIDGYLFGAFPALRPGVSVASILRGTNGPLIVLLWVLGLAALSTAWWYGRHLLGRGLLTHRWIVVTAALWILPMLVIPPLASRDMYSYACQGALFDAGYNPQHDPISAQPCPWIESVSVRWRDTVTPYGPLFILLTGVAAGPGSLTAALVAFRLLAVFSVVLLAILLPVLARRVAVPADRALWLVLCCPLVPVHLVGGGHNEALTVALLVAGLVLVAGPSRRTGALLAGGVLLGLSISVKTVMGVALPFAALLAARPALLDDGPALLDDGPALRDDGSGLLAGRMALRRGVPVVVTAIATLLVLSAVSGLGLFGWVTALAGVGDFVSWTSPPTAVGIAVDAVGRWFGSHLDAVPVTRGIALALLPIVLVVIFLRSRFRDPLRGAGLALASVVFLAPVTQPWYLIWALVLFAVTRVRARWLVGAVVFSLFTVLPSGDGALNPLRVPLSFLMTALVGWVTWRALRRLRGADLLPIDA